MPNNVTNARGCIDYIKSKGLKVLNREQVRRTITLIGFGRLEPSLKTNRDHVAHVKKIIVSEGDSKSCPKCGSKMVLRVAKKGANAGNKFWGCSTFPKCRAIVKITQLVGN